MSYPIATLITSYVDGAYLAPRAGSHHLPVINPATESVIAQLQEADGAEMCIRDRIRLSRGSSAGRASG